MLAMPCCVITSSLELMRSIASSSQRQQLLVERMVAVAGGGLRDLRQHGLHGRAGSRVAERAVGQFGTQGTGEMR